MSFILQQVNRHRVHNFFWVHIPRFHCSEAEEILLELSYVIFVSFLYQLVDVFSSSTFSKCKVFLYRTIVVGMEAFEKLSHDASSSPVNQ